jgi:hypothetical protein
MASRFMQITSKNPERKKMQYNKRVQQCVARMPTVELCAVQIEGV